MPVTLSIGTTTKSLCILFNFYVCRKIDNLHVYMYIDYLLIKYLGLQN